jgi:hypothetical protein
VKAKLAASVVLLCSILLCLLAAWVALFSDKIALLAVFVVALVFIAPVIGLYLRANWCRIFLGICYTPFFIFFLTLPLSQFFYFRPVYLAALLGSAIPVFLLFFYRPLKTYTRNTPSP